jgi:hypothetical protein
MKCFRKFAGVLIIKGSDEDIAMTQLEEALALALKLAPKERLQLIEKLAVSVEHEIETKADEEAAEHWGQNLLKLVYEIGIVDLDYPEIEDPVEWVKRIRYEQDKKRFEDWGEDLSPHARS